jgi:hypothetical protein
VAERDQARLVDLAALVNSKLNEERPGGQ